MIEILLILFYTGLFCWIIRRSKHFKVLNLSRETIISIFIIKVIAGIMYGIIYTLHFWGGDTIIYFSKADVIFKTFPQYPWYYVHNIFGYYEPQPPNSGVMGYPTPEDYWHYLGVYSLLHLHTLIRVVSFGYYSIHVIFMAFFSLIAGLNLYKVFFQDTKVQYKVLLAAIFFVPSVVFWTTGIHKDGFVYLGISFLLLGLYRLPERLYSVRNYIYIILGFGLTILMRSYLIYILGPVIVSYLISLKRPQKVFQTFIMVLGTFFVIFSIVQLAAPPDHKPLHIVVNKHNDFLNEIGSSDYYVPPLTPSLLNFITFAPYAFSNTLLRPYITEAKDILQIFASLEMILFLILVAVMIAFYRKNSLSPILGFILFYGLSNFLMIGLLLSNAGTISRYRAVSLGLLTIFITSRTDYPKVKEWIGRKLGVFRDK